MADVQEMQHLELFSCSTSGIKTEDLRRSSCPSNRSPAGPSCNTGKLPGLALLVETGAGQRSNFENAFWIIFSRSSRA